MTTESAAELYRSGAFTPSLKAALEGVDGPDPGAALLIAGKCLVALGNLNGLAQVIAVAQKNGAPPARTLFRLLHDCLADGLHRPVQAIGDAVPEGNDLFPIALYHASCARLVLGDEAGAMAGFDRFRLALPRYLDRLPLGSDDEFNVMFRQGTLVLPPEQTAQRIAQGAAAASAQSAVALLQAPAAAADGPVLLCCADARYVAHFLPRWLAALAPLGKPIHVHVVDPDPDSPGFVADQAARTGVADRLSLSTSIDRHHNTTSYACARFELIPFLSEILGRPLLALDIDSGALPALAELMPLAEAADFACFESGRSEPASVHLAGIMAFAPTAAARRFAEELAAYCRPKLHQPVRVNWMLDQAALFSVLRLYRRSHPGFRYLALDQRLGRPLTAFLVGLASDEEKHAIKVEHAGLAAGAPESGLVGFAWEP